MSAVGTGLAFLQVETARRAKRLLRPRNLVLVLFQHLKRLWVHAVADNEGQQRSGLARHILTRPQRYQIRPISLHAHANNHGTRVWGTCAVPRNSRSSGPKGSTIKRI